MAIRNGDPFPGPAIPRSMPRSSTSGSIASSERPPMLGPGRTSSAAIRTVPLTTGGGTRNLSPSLTRLTKSGSNFSANPEDDNVRLVYADWLEEHGDEAGIPDALARAEFIRLQVRLSPSDAPRWDDPDGFDRMQDLEQKHRAAWLAELPKVPGVPY